MTNSMITFLAACFQAAVFLILVCFSVRLLRKNGRALVVVFLTFFFSLWLLSDLYWVIYDFIRPNSRMPFAANEIGEASVFLLESAVLCSAINIRPASGGKQAVGALLFAACNIALWIAWSGEWIEDILIGVIFAYLLYNSACSLKILGALKTAEWISVGIAGFLLIVVQAMTFFTKNETKTLLDTTGYLLLTAGIFFWALKLFLSWKNHRPPVELLCLGIALLAWELTAKYMSDGYWYILFMTAETICMPFLYLSVRKVVAEQ